jgi:hypothetical protein
VPTDGVVVSEPRERVVRLATVEGRRIEKIEHRNRGRDRTGMLLHGEKPPLFVGGKPGWYDHRWVSA